MYELLTYPAMQTPLAIFTFIFGLLIGSFLNVLIYRIPLGKSIVFPPSSCPKCKHTIKWYENIPVISWLFLRGKCSACKNPISPIYPTIELITALLFLFSFIIFGPTIEFLFILFFMASMVVISIIDIQTQDVYLATVVPLIIFAPLRAFFSQNITITESLIGIAVGGGTLLFVIGVFYLITKKIGMGFGDVYILAAAGGFSGALALPMIILIASSTAIIVFFLFQLVGTKRIAKSVTTEDIKSDNEDDLDRAIYFGPFIAFAAILSLLLPMQELFFSLYGF
ncbi:prepilin peptidase [bacterium]|nr:prepilin peptidase [bacterium]